MPSFTCLFLIVIPIEVKCAFILFFTCISLLHSMCLLATGRSHLEKCLCFVVFLLLLTYRNSLQSADMSPLSDMLILPFMLCTSFHCLDSVLWWAKVSNFPEINLLFVIASVLLESYPRNTCQIQCHEDSLLSFLSVVVDLTLSLWSILSSFLQMIQCKYPTW
jgi:hypothetical protein